MSERDEVEVLSQDALRRVFDRYAYQTRHGTDIGAELVLSECIANVQLLVKQAAGRAREEEREAAALVCDAVAREREVDCKNASDPKASAMSAACKCAWRIRQRGAKAGREGT